MTTSSTPTRIEEIQARLTAAGAIYPESPSGLKRGQAEKLLHDTAAEDLAYLLRELETQRARYQTEFDRAQQNRQAAEWKYVDMREAAEWYADPANWVNRSSYPGGEPRDSFAIDDEGAKARELLANAGEYDPMDLAQQFHEAYERLAPEFGYSTREASRKTWGDVPENNRHLMTAVCCSIMGLSRPIANLPARCEKNT
jgi:hypothetical protein